MTSGKIRGELVYASIAGFTSLLLFSAASRTPGFYNGDEGVYAEVAREMAKTGHLFVPHLNGVPYFEKPPLVYWLCAASFRALGDATWVGRLPIVLSGALGVVALFWLVALWGDKRAAGFASTCLATSFGYFLYARILMLEVPLVALFIAATLTFFMALRQRDRSQPLLMALTAGLLGLAVMVKGLIGIAMPVLALGAAAVFSRNLRTFSRTVPWLSMTAAFVAVAAPWHLIVEFRHPGAMDHYLVRGQVLRYLAGARQLDVTPLGVSEYLIAAAAWFLPWVFFLPAAISSAIRDLRRCAPDGDLLAGGLAWMVVAVGFFAISPARLEYYSLPALPGMAILAGCWWSRVDFPSAGAIGSFAAILAVAVLGWIGTLLFIRPSGLHVPLVGHLYALINEHYRNAAAQPGSMPALPSAERLVPLMVGELTALSAAGVVGVFAQRQRMKLPAFAGVVVLALVSMFAVHSGSEILEPFYSVGPLARKVGSLIRDDDCVAVIGAYENVAPMGFYLRRTVIVVDGFDGDLRFGRLMDPTTASYFVDDATLRKLWAGNRRIFLAVNTEIVTDPPLPEPAYQLLRQASGSLYSNRP